MLLTAHFLPRQAQLPLDVLLPNPQLDLALNKYSSAALASVLVYASRS